MININYLGLKNKINQTKFVKFFRCLYFANCTKPRQKNLKILLGAKPY